MLSNFSQLLLTFFLLPSRPALQACQLSFKFKVRALVFSAVDSNWEVCLRFVIFVEIRDHFNSAKIAAKEQEESEQKCGMTAEKNGN